jgi:hypothetical protein
MVLLIFIIRNVKRCKRHPQMALWISYFFDIPRHFSTLQAFKVNILQCIPIISYRGRVHLRSFQVLLILSLNPDFRLLVERSTYFCIYPSFNSWIRNKSLRCGSSNLQHFYYANGLSPKVLYVSPQYKK